MYSIVEAGGMHGSGEIVRALKRGTDIRRLLKAAKLMTHQYQTGMAQYGGSTGYYKVVEGVGPWLGHEVDLLPSIE